MNKIIFCTQEVKKKHVRREVRNGVEHIIITSYTLPPDIVMNGVLYPKEITQRDFKTFNRTPATIEHPKVDGNFVLASDPEADIDYRIGAFNDNAELLEDGRLKLDKVINVKKAMSTDKGKRLLDRIEEIENSDKARPMHTSIGALVEVEMFDEEQTAFNGAETNSPFSSVVTSMLGDHDAFLLDSSGAATPTQGTGIGINSEQLKVEEFFITNNDSEEKPAKDFRTNQELSFDEIRSGIYKALEDRTKGIDKDYCFWVVEIYDDNFIYELENTLYRAGYSVDSNGVVTVQDDKQEVVLKKEYVDKEIQTIKKGEDMISREELIALLTSADIAVNAEISEADLVKKLESTLADGKETLTVNSDLTGTVKTLTDKIETLESELATNAEKDLGEKIKTIKQCSKYSALPDSALKHMAVNSADEFKDLYADSIPSDSVGSTHLNNNSGNQLDDDMFAVNTIDSGE